MSDMKWTKDQESAITSRRQDLLLSAAAGSGKTAVLVERIIRHIIDDGWSVTDLLVLTFTRAAAGEMKNRIASALSARLSETRDQRLMNHLENQLALLGSAQISTIDSFCQFVLRQYNYRLDVDPEMQILTDDNQLAQLEDEVMTDVLLQWYRKDDPRFRRLTDMFSERYQDGRLRETILKLYDFSRALPFPETWLSSLAAPYSVRPDAPIDSLPWIGDIVEDLSHQAEGWADDCRYMIDLAQEPGLTPYLAALEKDFDAVSLLAAKRSWQDWYDTLRLFEPAKLKSVRKNSKDIVNPAIWQQNKDAISTIRNKMKDGISDVRAQYFSVPPETWVKDLAATAPLAAVLSEVTQDFAKAFQKRKEDDAVMTFSDLSHYALSILLAPESTAGHPVPSEAAKELSRRYREIMIDEYQDTNGVQELITNLVAAGHEGEKTPRFLVGDVKQSIYRFRLADPGNFLEKHRTFSKDPAAPARRIDLNLNFRSDAAILSGTNFIFRQIMKASAAFMDYREDDALHLPPAAEEKEPPLWIGSDHKVDVLLLNTGTIAPADGDEEEAADEEDAPAAELEGRLIARRLRAYIDAGALVKDKDGYRPLRFGDAVILLRSLAGQAPSMLKAFREEGIPAVCDQDEDFMRSMEVLEVRALLTIIDNPLQDIPLAAVLRFFAGLDENDLIGLRLMRKPALWDAFKEAAEKESSLSPEARKKCRTLFASLTEWRRLSRRGSVSDLISRILSDTDFLTYVSGLPGGMLRISHVNAFLRLAKTFDDGPMSGLYRFLTYLGKAEKSAREFKSAAASGESNAVRIMTIHKSKGLEFPLVFLAGANRSFNERDLKVPMILHKEKGMGLQTFDETSFCRWPTLYYQALRTTAKKENLAEEERLLYVAMTRAKEKLIITGHYGNRKPGTDAVGGAAERWTRGLTSEEQTLTDARILSAKCYLDWIMPAAARSRSMDDLWRRIDRPPTFITDPDKKRPASFRLTVSTTADLPAGAVEEALRETSSKNLIPPPSGNPVPPPLAARLAWAYPFPGAAATPAKLTATAAVRLAEEAASPETPPPALMTEEEAAARAAEKEDTDDEGKAPLPPDMAAPPHFLSEGEPLRQRGTVYGTVMHRAMELLDLPSLSSEEQIRNAISALAGRGAFTKEETALLLTAGEKNPIRDIAAFIASPLGHRMAGAKEIRKELPFSLLVPASEYYRHCEKGETVFLQGIIDCLLIEEEGLVIIDYKTDRVAAPGILRDRYRPQLLVYREAMETILQKPVKAMALWSFHLGKTVPVS